MATATIRIPTAFRSSTEGATELVVEAATVRDAVGQLTARYPSLTRQLVTTNGSLRNFVGVFVNGRDVRALERDATALSTGDVLTIVPAAAGG